MKTETAHALADRLAEFDIEVEVREDYSGRGMYGNTTAALVFDDRGPSTLLAIGWCARELTEEGMSDLELADLPSRVDSMGLGTIVY